MIMDTKILEDIGLTKGEIKAYLALLKLGQSSTGPIAKEANVSRSKLYVILDKLSKKEKKNRVNELLKQFDIESHRQKQIHQLSGGQQQRVAIAKCLSQDANLFLLDEPSAYLDVEQRLRISKIVRERMESSGKTA